MTRPVRRRTRAAGLVAVAVCIGLAFASAFAPPTLITSAPGPVADQRGRSVILPTASGFPAPTLIQPPRRNVQVPEDVQSILGTLLALAALAAVILIVVRVARAFAARTAPARIDEVVTAPVVDAGAVQDAFRRAREQIALEDDANRAVIRCWESVESLGAEAGIPREASQTASEYVIGILSRLDAPAAPAARLSRLYTQALFAAAPLPAGAVVQARADLAELDAALARPGGRVPPAVARSDAGTDAP